MANLTRRGLLTWAGLGVLYLAVPGAANSSVDNFKILRTYRLENIVYPPKGERVRAGLEFEGSAIEDSALKQPYFPDLLNVIKAARQRRTGKTIQESMLKNRGSAHDIYVLLSDDLYLMSGADGIFTSENGVPNAVIVRSNLKNPLSLYVLAHELGHASHGEEREHVADFIAHADLAAVYTVCPSVRTIPRKKDPILKYFSLLDGVLDEKDHDPTSRFQYVHALYSLLFDNDKKGINFRNVPLEEIFKAFENYEGLQNALSRNKPKIPLMKTRSDDPGSLNKLGYWIRYATLDYINRNGKPTEHERNILEEKLLGATFRLTHRAGN